MANLIVVCGPQAVGKMTVAESLRDKLRYNMMMNHDSIELSDRIFGFATPAQREYNAVIREKADGGGEFYFVELSADLETRLARNETPHRMERKASKRDVAWSRENLLKDAEKYRLNSDEGEYWFEHHLKIDNTNLDPDEVADRVIAAFHLTAREKAEKEYRFGV